MMPVRAGLKFASGTDTGRRRSNNEDRIYVDADRGIYAVIDGVGGQAAGERAAETAVEVMRERLERPTGTPEKRLREAIALANNEIFRLAGTHAEWTGMACVLTVALIEDDIVTVGHVGDSRLYLLQPGRIAKITHDHSPVGEREDLGELGELEAMRHARRNEIYRDVGSGDREPDDPAFVEIATFAMPADGALLLCSDGLSDLITSEQIRAGLERYAPDYDGAIRALIDAANHAGGKDNVSVIVVASPGYNPKPVMEMPRPVSRPWPFMAAGLLLGALLGFLGPRLYSRYAHTDPVGINAALAQAHAGDTVVIPQGKYREQVYLREGITLRAQQPGGVTITPPDGGPAVVAEKLTSGAFEGFWVLGGGIEIDDSTIQVSNVYVTQSPAGIQIRGHSEPIITASQILNNHSAGVLISGGASPKLERNLIAANGKAGVEVDGTSHPFLRDNAIVDNGAEAIVIHGRDYLLSDYAENYFGKPIPKVEQAVPPARPPIAPVHPSARGPR